MKVNLRKIGAIVAGATILASSVAFAGLSYFNTQLVNDNGQPVVKVVVGENAAASDGVAAANIAAKIANEAYKTQTLTAQVKGDATCTAGTGAGTCAVSDKKVTLEITAPGAAAEGSYTVSSLIGDDIDRLLLDRGANALSTSGYAYGSDVVTDSNPFTNGASAAMSGAPDYVKLYRIDGSMFSPLASTTVDDTYAGKSYKETQNVWMNAYTYYGSSDEQIVAPVNILAYSLKFSGATDDLGIQKCTTPTNSTFYAYCTPTTDSDYLTSTHKVQLQFLGETWYISEMSPPTTSVTSELTVSPGGYVKLAKESTSGILNVGDSGFDVGDVKIVLDDIEAHGDTTSAIISVVDKNGAVLKKDKANAGVTKDITVDGVTYKVHVYKIAPGYTFGAKWADMAIYSKEIKLNDGQKLDPDYDSNKYWKVSVGWKNKGASSTDTTLDSLRTIILYTTTTESLIPNAGTMRKGEFIPMIQDPVNWKMTYAGLSTVDYDSLTFRLMRSTNRNNLLTYVQSASLPEYCNITFPYVQVNSEKDSAFTVDSGTMAGTTSATASKFYVATTNASCNSTPILTPGSLFIPLSSTSDDYWVYKNYSYGQTTIKYDTVGDSQSWAGGGLLTISKLNDTNYTGTNFYGVINFTQSTASPWWDSSIKTDWVFGLSEKAGTGESYSYVDKLIFGLDLGTGTMTDATFNYDEITTSIGGKQYFKKDYVWYIPAGPHGSTGATKEGTYSDRGSKYVSTDDEQVKFTPAKTLAYAQFVLSTSGASSTPDTVTKILTEGQDTTVNGVKVLVKEISEKVGACSVGTGSAPSCTVDTTGVTATIMPDDVATLNAAIPYAMTSSLVVLDKDALDTDTVVTVGGPVVNTVTKAALEGSAVDFTATPKVVKEVVAGKKIVVAGLSADDTLEAAKDFVAALKRQ